MAKCELCSDESSILHEVESPEGNEYYLCKKCLKLIHEAYVELK